MICFLHNTLILLGYQGINFNEGKTCVQQKTTGRIWRFLMFCYERHWMGYRKLEYFCPCLFMAFFSYKLYLETLLVFCNLCWKQVFSKLLIRDDIAIWKERMWINILDISDTEPKDFLKLWIAIEDCIYLRVLEINSLES